MPITTTSTQYSNDKNAYSIIAFLDCGLTAQCEEEDLQYLNFVWRTQCADLLEPEAEPVIDRDSYENYLSLASRMEPEMSVEAEVLLHSYHSASKMARATGLGGSGIPPSALTTITSLSVGIAKLQLHFIVTESDAVLGIYLYEEYITSRCGLSVLNIQPQPDIPWWNTDQFVGMENDICMEQFHQRLQQFCSRVNDQVSFHCPFNLATDAPFKEE